MKEQNLQAMVEAIWPQLKKRHLYPEIPMPKIGEMDDSSQSDPDRKEGVGLEMKQKQMTINPQFLSEMKGKMAQEQVIEALLDHGIAHYTFCPWDFQNHLMLYAEAKKIMGDKELAKQVADYFIDVIANTHCVKKGLTSIPELYRHLEKGMVEEVIASLYEKIWGTGLGSPRSKSKSEGYEEIVRRLARIPYLNRSK